MSCTHPDYLLDEVRPGVDRCWCGALVYAPARNDHGQVVQLVLLPSAATATFTGSARGDEAAAPAVRHLR